MDVFVAPGSDEMGKFRGVVAVFPHVWDGFVLDVGCRSGKLKLALCHRNVRYCGLDLKPPASVVGNLESGLPFSGEAFDTVVALDVLEHTDDIYGSFRELCRVSRKFVVISLPNGYEIGGRLRFLLGRTLSGKYGLPQKPPGDRHRWLLSFAEAKDFCTCWAERSGFRVLAECCLIGPKRGVGLGRLVVALSPDLFSPHYLVLLGRKGCGPTIP